MLRKTKSFSFVEEDPRKSRRLRRTPPRQGDGVPEPVARKSEQKWTSGSSSLSSNEYKRTGLSLGGKGVGRESFVKYCPEQKEIREFGKAIRYTNFDHRRRTIWRFRKIVLLMFIFMLFIYLNLFFLVKWCKAFFHWASALKARRTFVVQEALSVLLRRKHGAKILETIISNSCLSKEKPSPRSMENNQFNKIQQADDQKTTNST